MMAYDLSSSLRYSATWSANRLASDLIWTPNASRSQAILPNLRDISPGIERTFFKKNQKMNLELNEIFD